MPKEFYEYSGPTIPVEINEVRVELTSIIVPTYSGGEFTGYSSVENLTLQASVIDSNGDTFWIYEALTLDEVIEKGLCTELQAVPISLFLDLMRTSTKTLLTPPNLLIPNSVSVAPVVEDPTIGQTFVLTSDDVVGGVGVVENPTIDQ